MNNAPTLLKARGKTIKQGDTSSLLVFMLRNSLNEDMLELEGKQATVTFKCDEGIAFRKTLTVTESKIQFSIDTVLAVGIYDVEVTCEGYIFPSKAYSVMIEVTQSHKEYTDVASLEEIPTLDLVNQLIAKSRYDDSSLQLAISQLATDYASLVKRVEALENKPEVDTSDLERRLEEVPATVRELLEQELAHYSRAISMTKAEYEALETKDQNTFYIIMKEK